MPQVRTPGETCWGGVCIMTQSSFWLLTLHDGTPLLFLFFFPEMPPFVEFVLVGNRTVRCVCVFLCVFV